MRLSVIIVNYNVKYFLEQCLLSVAKATSNLQAEVWVVDNASQDGSRSYLESRFPDVHFIWSDENSGFAKANNQALKQATGEYILFLNPDTIVAEDCFSSCIAFMEQHADAGAVGIRMLDGKGSFLPESKRSFPSPLTSLYKLSGLSALFPSSRTFGRYHLGHLNEHQNHEVDVLAGAFMLIRHDVLKQTGGFDESFFMYGEDIDLSYRIQKTACPATGGFYKNYYLSDSSILHYKGESTRKGTLNYVRMFYQAMSLFVQKHSAASSAGIFTALINIAIWARAFLSILKRFIQKIGLPLLDAALIYLAFWMAQGTWVTFVKPANIYQRELLSVAFLGFSVLFLLVSYYTGLYEKKYRSQRLWRSMLVTLIINLAVYSLLPERFRFSRGMVLVGSVFSFGLLALWRWILLLLKVVEPDESEEENYTIVVGTAAQMEEAKKLLDPAGKAQQIRGFVSPLPEVHSLGTPAQLPQILENTPVKELILCESNSLSFKDIIAVYQQSGRRVKLRLHAGGSLSIVGSDSKNYSGETIGVASYRLSLPINRRLKRLVDVAVSLFLILLFPLHFLFNRHPLVLLQHCFQVLFAQKTWIGFTGPVKGLPPVKPSVLGPAGVPHQLNSLKEEGLQLANEWYAQQYEPAYDLLTVFSHYKNLGLK